MDKNSTRRCLSRHYFGKSVYVVGVLQYVSAVQIMLVQCGHRHIIRLEFLSCVVIGLNVLSTITPIDQQEWAGAENNGHKLARNIVIHILCDYWHDQ